MNSNRLTLVLVIIAVAIIGGWFAAGYFTRQTAVVFTARGTPTPTATPAAATAEPEPPALPAAPQTEAQSPAPAADAAGRINVNTATAEELKQLPGVGDVIAGNIIEYREAAGGFKSVDELINVKRIGAKTLERLRDLVTVE